MALALAIIVLLGTFRRFGGGEAAYALVTLNLVLGSVAVGTGIAAFAMTREWRPPIFLYVLGGAAMICAIFIPQRIAGKVRSNLAAALHANQDRS